MALKVWLLRKWLVLLSATQSIRSMSLIQRWWANMSDQQSGVIQGDLNGMTQGPAGLWPKTTEVVSHERFEKAKMALKQPLIDMLDSMGEAKKEEITLSKSFILELAQSLEEI